MNAPVLSAWHNAKPLSHWPAARATYLGLDQSLTRFGVSVQRAGLIRTFILTPPPDRSSGVKRLAWFRSELTRIITLENPAGIAMEGYAFGASSHHHALGELGGVVKMCAHDCGRRLVIVPPNTLKLFATGKGNASKAVVVKEAFKRWGVDVGDDNEADAAVLSLMAHACAASLPGLTAFQRKALDGVER